MTTQFQDLSGQVYGRLTVRGWARRKRLGGKTKGGWVCQCSCGNITFVSSRKLRKGRVKSCGCWKREMYSIWATGHGLYYHRLYGVWKNMAKRCYGSRSKDYRLYGARGIEICAQWKNHPEHFINYVQEHLGPRPTPAHSIDRIDNNSHYQPGNIRWASPVQQRNNRGHSRVLPLQEARYRINERPHHVHPAKDELAQPSGLGRKVSNHV